MKWSSKHVKKADFYRILLLFTFIFYLICPASAQPFSFAHVTDTHVGGSTGAEDLERTVADINALPETEFVLVTGDITEFGSGEELQTAKKILDKLNKPYYVVPGNHDSKWSESGCSDFVKIFGSETFTFEKNGYLFIGTASGPNMRMAPALVPREQLVFLDSLLRNLPNPDQPIIFINHYPLDASMSNADKVIEMLKTANTRVTLLGHGHSNRLFDFEGIPGIMGRSNLRAAKESGGYNICTISNDTLFHSERITGEKTLPSWSKVPIVPKVHTQFILVKPGIIKNESPEPTGIKVLWEFQEKSDIGSGIVVSGKLCAYTSSDGRIIARNTGDGEVLWEHQTAGKVFSTPAIRGNRIISPSTDGMIRCLDKRTGKILWEYATEKPIVASPVIRNHKVYTGSSEGIFRAVGLRNGQLLWQTDSIRNFVETRPLLYKKAIYFGSWGNTFYALDQKTGELLWKREKYTNRMLSPAAVWPVAAAGKVFIVAPDRRFTALDAKTGEEIWDSGKYSCRESIGISDNKKLVYIKNMTEGNVDAFYTRSDTLRLAWECPAGLGYEIAPSPITEKGKLVFIPTTAGIIYAINKKNHLVEWKFHVSEALINHILPIGKQRLLVTTFDGRVVCLSYGQTEH